MQLFTRVVVNELLLLSDTSFQVADGFNFHLFSSTIFETIYLSRYVLCIWNLLYRCLLLYMPLTCCTAKISQNKDCVVMRIFLVRQKRIFLSRLEIRFATRCFLVFEMYFTYNRIDRKWVVINAFLRRNHPTFCVQTSCLEHFAFRHFNMKFNSRIIHSLLKQCFIVSITNRNFFIFPDQSDQIGLFLKGLSDNFSL